MNGAWAIAQQLKCMGVKHLFGLPGTQNALLYCELADAQIVPIPAMHEMGAGFAALGYAATSDQPAVLALIGGPGFSYAITPLLEAKLDSIPLVCLVFARKPHPQRTFGSQEIDHAALGAACCKETLIPHDDEHVLSLLVQAWNIAQQGEPGPVMVLIDADYLARSVSGSLCPCAMPDRTVDEATVDLLWQRLQVSQRPAFLVGRGALAAPDALQVLAEHFQAGVITTTSARGVISEQHPLSLPSDLREVDLVNQYLATTDQIVAWGVKFSHNGAKGFGLQLPREKLWQVDAAAHVLGANYACERAVQCDVPALLRQLAQRATGNPKRPQVNHLVPWRTALVPHLPTSQTPHIAGVTPANPHGFFATLREVMPPDAILVLDSGYHQNLARTLFVVASPHGMLLPTGLQSMGFALPAAIGAALAAPQRRVVALLGDGGLRMCGMEILSAIQAGLPLVVIVFDDGYYGLIRQQQLNTSGNTAAITLQPIDYEAWALSQQVAYFEAEREPMVAIRQAIESDQPALVVIRLSDTIGTRLSRFKANLRRQISKLNRRRR